MVILIVYIYFLNLPYFFDKTGTSQPSIQEAEKTYSSSLHC